MTNIDGLTNTWDFKDRLVAVENEKMRAEYTYDYTDRRILKRVWEKQSTSGTDETNRNAPDSTLAHHGLHQQIL
jgi:hypothetical protein